MPTDKKDKCSNTSYDFTSLSSNWPSPLVLRDQTILDRFSGGILKAKTLANYDSLGIGPRERIRIGNRIAYPKESLVAWMQERMR